MRDSGNCLEIEIIGEVWDSLKLCNDDFGNWRIVWKFSCKEFDVELHSDYFYI